MKKILLIGMAALFVLAAGCGNKTEAPTAGAASGGGSGGGAKAEEKAAADLLAVLDGSDVEAIGKALSNANASVLATLASISGAPGGDFSYDLNEEGNGIVITKYSGAGGVVVIPAAIEDIPVMEIANRAFMGSFISSNGTQRGGQGDMIRSVVVPAGVQKIGFEAFYKCERMTSVILPDTLKVIGLGAFESCPNLHTVNIPAGVRIFTGAFSGCGNLYNVTLPEGEVSFSREGGAYKTGSGRPLLADAEKDPDFLGMIRWSDFVDNMAIIEMRDGNNDAFRGCQKLRLADRQKLKNLGYTGTI